MPFSHRPYGFRALAPNHYMSHHHTHAPLEVGASTQPAYPIPCAEEPFPLTPPTISLFAEGGDSLELKESTAVQARVARTASTVSSSSSSPCGLSPYRSFAAQDGGCITPPDYDTNRLTTPTLLPPTFQQAFQQNFAPPAANCMHPTPIEGKGVAPPSVGPIVPSSSPSLPNPVTCFHTALHGDVPFHPYPSQQRLVALRAEAAASAGNGGVDVDGAGNISKPKSRKNAKYQLFIGQVTFETTPELLRWVISLISGSTEEQDEPAIIPQYLHRRGAGCFMVYLTTPEDVRRLLAFHDSVLFDTRGIWVAATPTQKQHLAAHMEEVAGNQSALRLPKSCMVIRK